MSGAAPSAALAASPTMVGALTVLITILAVFLAYNANSGLPFVPTYQLTAAGPERRTRWCPGNEVRIGGVRVGHGRVDRAGRSTRTARVTRQARPEARPRRRADPDDSTVIVRSRSALGLKYLEISTGTSDGGLPGGRDACRSRRPTPEPVEIDEVLNIFDEPTATRDPGEPGRVRQRARRPRRRPERGDRRAARRCSPRARAGDAQPRATRAPASSGFFPALADDRGRGRARRRAAGAHVRRPRHHLHRARERRAAVHPGDDLEIAADPGHRRLETLPRSGRSSTTRGALHATCSPGVRRPARQRARDRRGARGRRPGPARRARAQRQLAPTAAALLRLQRRRGRPRRASTADRDGRASSARRCSSSRPAQTRLQLRVAPVRNARSASRPRRRPRHLAALHRLRPARTGRTTRAAPRRRRPTAAGTDERNFLHVNPYPNTARPGQTVECEAGNEAYPVGQQVIGNVPGQPGHATEEQVRRGHR